jgi:hypothetical protein
MSDYIVNCLELFVELFVSRFTPRAEVTSMERGKSERSFGRFLAISDRTGDQIFAINGLSLPEPRGLCVKKHEDFDHIGNLNPIIGDTNT